MGKASTPKKVENAMDSYKKAVEDNTGKKGYNEIQKDTAGKGSEMAKDSLLNSLENSKRVNDESLAGGKKSADEVALYSTNTAINNGSQMTAAQNEQARKYAGQQAQAAAAGAQSQATTAARAAGMNKAQAAMMGSQQNANAYQNAYGNAYGQQLGNAANNQNVQLSNYSNAFENGANRMNANINNQQGLVNSNQLNQQQLMTSLQGAEVTGKGNTVSMEQGQDAQNYAQGGLFSDEKLKKYKECSKKVVMRTPSKIQALKVTTKGV